MFSNLGNLNSVRFYLSLILAFGFIFEISYTQQNGTAEYRLPTSVVPTRYHLRILVLLDPYPPYEQFTAPSYVTINVTCLENTDKIYLHTVDLTISHETVRVYFLQLLIIEALIYVIEFIC